MRARRASWWGIAFVILLLVQAAMADIPTLDMPVARIQRFYAEHAGTIRAAQVISIIASMLFLLFAWAVADQFGGERSGGATRLRATGAAVAVASIATAVPPLWLALLWIPTYSTVHALTRAADLTDAILFTAIAFFSAEVARDTALGWLKGLALAVAVLSLVRAVLGFSEVTALDVVAPLAFLVLVLGMSLATLRGRLGAPAPPA